MQKGTVLYKAMAKYRRKFFVCNLILLVLLVSFAAIKMPYIKAEIFGAKPLDMERFLSETDILVIDELVELDRHDEKLPNGYYFKENSYWQDDVYFFDIKIEKAEKTNISFSNKLEYEGTSIEYPIADIWYAEAGGRTFVVIGEPDKKYKGTLSGYIVEPSRAIISEISKTLENGEEKVVADYFIDCRKTEMGTSDTDWTFVKIMSVILLLLFIKLGVYYAKPILTPTYRQLRRYGNIEDVADEINRQAESDDTYFEGTKIITPEFILSNSLFKKKVVKNHMSKN